jgi:glycosyltransferase involved in cell wall biosynthesis
MKTTPWRLFVDIQFMQTGAFHRGMGQHVRGLFKSIVLHTPPEIESIFFVYSSNLDRVNIEQFKDELNQLKPDVKLSFHSIETCSHDLSVTGEYDSVYVNNANVVTDFYDKHKLGDDYWFNPCPMQEPVVPALPLNENLRKGVLWYDLMPYLMHDHYFPDATTPHAHSYLSRINMLLDYDQILTISETSKQDLVRYISLDPNLITNTQGWVNTEIQGEGNLPKGVRGPFFLLNASPEPNKNALNAIKAFGIFNSSHGEKYQLVITSDYDRKLAEQASLYATNVHFIGHVSSEDLKCLYDQCEALFFPSLYEGLGLPPLEAINFGKKVVCADIPVLRESGADEAFYWCDPTSPDDMARALRESCASSQLSEDQMRVYADIKSRYSWDISAKLALDAMVACKSTPLASRRIAIVGPHPSSFSSIGKFMVEAYQFLYKHAKVDYFYDQGPSDRRHGHVRFCYLQASPHLLPVRQLVDNISDYDRIIYHMGNSDHHMVTYLLAHSHPDTLILHDTNLGGDGLSGQMLSNGFISKERLDLENKIETEYLKQPERFITSLVSSQKRVVTHSEFAANIVEEYDLNPKKSHAVRLQHPIQTIQYRTPKQFNRTLRFGIAGIVTDVKGVNSIEWLMDNTNNLEGAELYIFGFGFFADKTTLRELQDRYPNVHVAFDLTDLQFNNLLSSLDLLINYRETYKGEASRATLEAMRERVVPIVRKVGWFDELPDDAAYKLESIEDMPALIRSLLSGGDKTQKELHHKISAGQNLLLDEFDFQTYQKAITG